MNKMLLVAWREFSSTALTKGFLIGLIITPLMIGLSIGAIFLMKGLKGPQIVGSVALVDQSGLVAERAAERFSEAAAEKEAQELSAKVGQAIDESGMAELAGANADAARAQAEQAAREAARKGAKITLEILPADSDVDAAKKPLENAEIVTTRGHDDSTPASRVAVIVIPPAAVNPDENGEFARFTCYFADKLDFEIQDRIQDRIADAIVDARVANDPRIAQAGLTPEAVLKLVRHPGSDEIAVKKGGGETKSLGGARMLIPMGFIILLWIAVFTGGQYLLTTTVEEKSTRVMELLLSAASPMQIMVGKILGQMFVGLLILVLYSGLAIGGVVIALKQADLISGADIAYLLIFFAIAYFLVASMMAAIGSAVNDMREAQTLMTPVMVILMLPWLCWFLIQRAPNSVLATTLSFIPGINPFAMVLRLSGSEPVPTWQIPVSILVGVLSVIFAAWASAKIFRIGVLMYGKPPNLATLIKWVRMA